MTQRLYPSLARRLHTGGLPGMLFSLAMVLAWDARAVTTTLDGTSGNNVISTVFSTTDDLTINQGFFVDYLVVGGGGGGASNVAGGGGAGGVVTGSTAVSATNYTVTVGSGGGGGSLSSSGSAGGNSSALGVTAGGGVGGYNHGDSGQVGRGGDSGSPQSRTGGAGWRAPSGAEGAAGGGGAGSGADGSRSAGNSVGANGGGGMESSITGASVTYAGGGGGGSEYNLGGSSASGAGGSGGGGGGGLGQSDFKKYGGNATGYGSGGGGGGAYSGPGGKGSAGLTVLRYQGASVGNVGGTVSSGTGWASGYTLHTFTSSGNFNLSGVDFNSRLRATLTGNIFGSGSLIVDTLGTLSVAGTKTYTGTTVLREGTLSLAADGNIAASSSITVESGGVLAGAGTVSDTSFQSGALHAPGGTGAAIQTIDGALTYASGSALQWNLLANDDDRGTDFDGVNVFNGSLAITSGAALNLAFNGTGSGVLWSDSFWDGNHSWTVIAPTGTTTIDPANDGAFTLGTISNDTGGNALAASRGRFVVETTASGVVLNYISQTPDATTSTVSANPTSLTAGSGATSTLTVQLKNAAGQNVTVGGATVTFANPSSGSIGPVTDVGNGTYTATYRAGQTAGSDTITPSVGGTALTNTATITLLVTQSGNITGNVSVDKTGPGTLTLTGTNTYTGPTTITDGTLQIGAGGANANTGTLGTGAVTITSPGTLALSRAGTLDVPNTLSGTGTLQQNGPGTAVLTGNNSNFSGLVDINGGTLQVGNGGTSGNLGTGAVSNDGALVFNRDNTAVLTVPNVISGSGTVTQAGPGTTVLSGQNTYIGGTAINAGTLQLGGNNVLPTSGDVSLNGGQLDLGGFSQTVDVVTLTSGTLKNGSLTASQYDVESGLISAVLAGSGNLNKTISGTVTLTGNNTYTGTTNIGAGTLIVNGNQAGSTGAVTVAAGAALGGSGTLGGPITVQGPSAPYNGGQLSPGTGPLPGVLTAANGLSLNSGSSLQWNLQGNDATAGNRGTGFDGVNVTNGQLSIASGVSSALVFNGSDSQVDFTNAFWQTGRSWVVFANANTPSLSSANAIFDAVTLTADRNGTALNSVTGLANAGFYWTTQGNDVVLVYSPGANTGTQLAIRTQPVGGVSGGVLATAPVIEIRNAQGQLINSTAAISVAIASGSGGTLGGSTTVYAVNGVATFSNLSLSGNVGTNYVLRFSGNSLTPVDATAITVSATVPGTPGTPAATAGNRQISLSWAAPTEAGGTPITGYTVTGTPGGSCTTTGATSCVISNLNNGTAYTFTVVARNAQGSGAPSSASASVMPLSGVAPMLFSVSPNAGPQGGGTTVTLVGTDLAGATAVRFGNIAAQSFQVLNENEITAVSPAQGGGAVAVSVTTPLGTGSLPNGFVYQDAPASPGAPLVAIGDRQATVSWAQVFSGGGNPDTYTVTASPGGRTCTVAFPGNAFPYASCVVTGLTNGQAYTFSVTATNSLGSSTSPVSASATPLAVINGSCGASNGIATLIEPQGALCSAGTASAVTHPAGTFDWSCQGQNGGTTQQCSAPGISSQVDQQTPSAVTLTSDAASNGCAVQSARLTTPPNQGPGNNVTMPYGAVSFEMVSCSPPQAGPAQITVRLTYADIVEGMQYWKYVVNNVHKGWTQMPANQVTLRGNTAEFTLVDNGEWDNDPAVGAIADPGGPGFDPNALTPPGQPTNVRVTPWDRSATVSWTAPTTGGQPAVYRAEALINGAPSGLYCEAIYPATQCSIQGLTNGQAYTVQVSAINGAGGSTPVVDPTPVTPRPTPPPPNPIPVMEEAGLITLATLMVMLGGWSQRRRHAHRGHGKIKNQGK